jgi:hypothetical protein
VLLASYYYGDEIKVDKMARACGNQAEERNSYRVSLCKTLRKNSFEDLGT